MLVQEKEQHLILYCRLRGKKGYDKMIPDKIKFGDEIRVIAPSRSLKILDFERNENAKRRIEELGFKVTFSRYANECNEDKCVPLEKRISDLHEAFLDKNVKAILTATGGYNSNQLLKYIDYNIIRNNPKIFLRVLRYYSVIQ